MARLALLLLAPLIALWLLAGALSVPDFPALAMAKLTEGGLWTGFAAFLVLACVLAVLPRRDGRDRG